MLPAYMDMLQLGDKDVLSIFLQNILSAIRKENLYMQISK